VFSLFASWTSAEVEGSSILSIIRHFSFSSLGIFWSCILLKICGRNRSKAKVCKNLFLVIETFGLFSSYRTKAFSPAIFFSFLRHYLLVFLQCSLILVVLLFYSFSKFPTL
ncbi:unnamed protein product, partial [Callosobruchus maculatus]